MSDKPQQETSEHVGSSKAPPSAIAALLIVGGVVLLVAAIASKQWLEARSTYVDDAAGPAVAGLFTDAASSAARFLAVVFFAATGSLALLGLVLRRLLGVALGFALLAAAAASFWICDEGTWHVGRAYTLGMFALAVLITGLAQAASATRSAAPSSVGSFVDGRKHGRWYVYDGRGQCVSMEDWEHGTLVSAKPQGRS